MDNPFARNQGNMIEKDIQEITQRLAEYEHNFHDKTILVTGSNGFLGKVFKTYFRGIGANVIAVDNFVIGNNEQSSDIHANITEPLTLDPSIKLDYIVNTAGIASPFHYRRLPLETLDVSYLGTKNMLELARQHKVASFLAFSSSEVYGDPDPMAVPTPESYIGVIDTMGERSCYDKDTEILTENGWVLFENLQKGVAVATLNQSGIVEYHIPDDIIIDNFSGNMKHFHNIKYDLLVTPNHKMYVQSQRGRKSFVRADESKNWHGLRMITGGVYSGEDKEWHYLGNRLRNSKLHVDKVRMDDWLELLGYYISEGCVCGRPRKRTVKGKEYNTTDFNVLISQVKLDNRRIISECLKKTGFPYYDSHEHQFMICSKQLYTIFKPLGKSRDKYIPREFMNLSPRQSKILLDALILGDGSMKSKDCICYFTISKQLADDVQELALRCGFAASISKSKRELYHVNIRPPRPAVLISPKDVPYNGKVYCVNVKNHVICVRRNNKAVFCGNSYDEGKRVIETLCYIYNTKYGVNTKIVRPFNVFGPPLFNNDYRVIPNFISRIINNQPLLVYGDGKQTRTFCYVTDFIVGAVKVLISGDNQPYNIGNSNNEISMLDLAKLIEKTVGFELDIRLIPYPSVYPSEEPRRRCPDLTKIKYQLDYNPTIDLTEGIKRFYSWANSKGVGTVQS